MTHPPEWEPKIVKEPADKTKLAGALAWRLFEGLMNVVLALIAIVVGILSMIAGLFGGDH